MHAYTSRMKTYSLICGTMDGFISSKPTGEKLKKGGKYLKIEGTE